MNNKNIKILILKNKINKGIFKIYPIDNGYGVTIGNSIRRILLSSLYGYAISYFKINKIKHEYTYINGIIEDVTEIILNLKQIIFKLKKNKKNIKKEKIKININNKKNIIYASDIDKFSKNFEVINKKQIICNKDENTNFNINLIINKGIGYEPSENKKKYKNYIPIDSFYSPIINVSFKVKNYYYDNEDLEILKIKILTNCSITPIKSLIKASKILIKIFKIFIKKNKYFIYNKNKNKNNSNSKNNIYDEKILNIRNILNTKLKNENFSVRTINCLNNNKIYKWSDLVVLDKLFLLKIKNLGKKSLNEIVNKMKNKNLKFKMNIKKYKL
ncbi:MAG: DNA-directed RNA polymerase subunit alpha [Candidatus Shikimatogenerans bostrichidophilus]|nr:MAG: DNA-directed RNA polymerase subunit alpha [Candidatus Shikimatogenerans bostrichidophilus]